LEADEAVLRKYFEKAKKETASRYSPDYNMGSDSYPQNDITMDMGCRTLPFLRGFSVMSVFCVHLVICKPVAALAGISRSSKLSSPLAGHAVQYVMAGCTACLS
jgi:hypothetical protein